MADTNQLHKLFSKHQKRLLAELGMSDVHDHPNAKGDTVEDSWREMFSKYLPDRYKVDRGFVIDHGGKTSDYIDIIIYDRYYSPIVFNEKDVMYVPAESVFAVIECKQKLTKGYIGYASNKAKSVRVLKRTSAPIRQMNDTVATKTDTKQILAGVVATKSNWKPPFGEPFKKAIAKAATVSPIDFGCALNDGSFSVTYGETNQPSVAISDSDSSLISFFVDLVARLQYMGNPPAIDLRSYFRNSKDS